MIIEGTNTKVVKHGILEEIKFTVEDDGGVIMQLVAGQYSNPIGAFVRELGVNAYEIHKQTGQESLPFLVELPDHTDNTFKIRDYGSGLSLEQVKSIYTCIGASTKRGSNFLGGGFGLGSKSPLAYTDSFSVNSYYNGIRYSYLVFKDEDGYPHFDLVEEVKTDEPNGLEIRVPIKDSDFNNVIKNCNEIYQHFIIQPKVVKKNGEEYKLRKATVIEKINNFTIYKDESSPYGVIIGPRIKMGNIVYPIDTSQSDLISYSNCNFTVELPIGSVDVSTSRETLKYTVKTRVAIKLAFDFGKRAFISKIEAEIDQQPDLWSASLKGHKAVRDYAFIKIKDIKYKGQSLLSDLISVNFAKLLEIRGGNLKEKRVYDNYIRLTDKVAVFNYDTEKDYKAKVKQHLQISRSSVAVLVRPDKVEDIKNLLKISDSSIVPISSIEYKRPVYKRTKGRTGYKILTYRGGRSPSTCWSYLNEDQVDQNECLFVYMKNYQPLYNNKPISNDFIGYLKDFINKPIFAVRMSGKVPPKWKTLESYIEEVKLVDKLSDQLSQQLSYGLLVRQYTLCQNLKLIKDAPKDITEFKELSKSVNIKSHPCLEQLIKQLGGEFKHKPTKIETQLKKIMEKYPLLHKLSIERSCVDEFTNFYLKRK